MNKIINKLKTLFKIQHNVISGEVDEILHLNPTEEDKAQGKVAAALAITALASCGVPLGALGTPVLEKVFTYVIRDVKDGVSTPEKLIVGRIVKEIKEENLKTKEQALYDNLNKK